MSTNESVQKSSYFSYRFQQEGKPASFIFPAYLLPELPRDKGAAILDIGCGLGWFLGAIKDRGYTNIQGVDVNDESIEACRQKGLRVSQIESISSFAASHQGQFELITMSHVLEHLPKEEVIATLKAIKSMLSPTGYFICMVPNGQSNTAAYWLFEDFTHYTLYTAGSLYYVFKAAGFNEIHFIDPKCLAGLSPWKAWRKKTLLRLYEIHWNFWNRVTSSSFHVPSPRIYSFEIKVKGR